MAHCWKGGDSLLDMCWLIVGDVVAHCWKCGGWLIVRNGVAHCWMIFSDSFFDMRWLTGSTPCMHITETIFFYTVHLREVFDCAVYVLYV